MKRALSVLAVVVVMVLLAGGVFVAAARAGWLTPSEATLRARYGTPGSRFMVIDGEPIHYVDEGHGEPVVLIHGSFGSLLMWSDWVKALSGRYRVIRFDRPPMGLSGPDPAGRYDVGREIAIVQALTTRLGLGRFYLVATSSGGESGAAYAAEHPEQIRGLILSNIAVGPLKLDRTRLSPLFKLVLMVDPWFKGWHPRLFWREVLVSSFADPSRVTPALVAQWTDLNNRAQRMARAAPAAGAPVPFARTPGDLARITAPTLLLWSDKDPEVPATPTARKALALLASKDKSLLVLADCGHMIAIECGPQSATAAGVFFDRLQAEGR